MNVDAEAIGAQFVNLLSFDLQSVAKTNGTRWLFTRANIIE